MNMNHPTAFAPFYDEKAIFSGERREAGATAKRPMSHRVPCCVLGGSPVDASNTSGTPTVEFSYTVKIRRADWPDHKPPQKGDILTIENRPVMNCLSCLPDGNDWSLDCRSKGALQ